MNAAFFGRLINPKTDKPVSFEGLPATDEQVREVIPGETEELLYKIKRAQGLSIVDAMIHVLQAKTGSLPPRP